MKTQIRSILLLLISVQIQAQTTDTVRITDVELLRMLGHDTEPAKDTFNNPNCWRHEFSIWTSGGISALNYKPVVGERTLGAGGMFGVGYTFFFNERWGVHTGAELALYNTSYRLRRLNDMYTRLGFDELTPGWSGEDEIIDYHTEPSNYTERQQHISVNIPLMMQFQTPISGSPHQFFAMGGGKLGIPIQSTYSVKNATLYTWYYDHKSNQQFRPDPTGYGTPWLEELGCFYNLAYFSEKKHNTFNLAGLISVEMGVKWRLNTKLSLYTGLFLDYGFNNIKKQDGHRFFEFDPIKADMVSNSILTSQFTHDGAPTQDFTQHISPVAFGVKIRLGINRCKVDRREVGRFNTQDLLNAYHKGFQDGCAHCADSKCSCSPCDDEPKQTSDSTPDHTPKPLPQSQPYPKPIEPSKPVVEEIKPAVQPTPQPIVAPNPMPITIQETGIRKYLSENRPKAIDPVSCVTSDILQQAEIERLSTEYGRLTDLVILNIDGYSVNQSSLTPIMKEMIDRKTTELQRYNTDRYTIIIEGHTCDLGASDVNLKLGLLRADVVRDYLIEKGFTRSNLTISSKGLTAPIVPNFDEPNRKINRRVVFLIVEK